MHYLAFTQPEKQTYPVCLLVPQIRKDDLLKAYITPFGLDPEEVIVIDVHHAEGKKKTPAAEMKAYIIEELLPVWENLNIEYVIVTDSEYFKILAKTTKVEAHLGYVMDCAFGPQKIVYVPSYKAIFYDPEKVQSKINTAMAGFIGHRTNTYQIPGTDIIKSALYPTEPADIEECLRQLHDYPELTCDIEGFSLKHHTSGIGTISFAINKHQGLAFGVDYCGRDPARIRAALRNFFETYQGKITYHSIAFDVYVLIFQLFMENILDTKGLLHGLEVMLKNWDCTKLITYLATNSCAGNRLDLKSNSQEFSGNYSLGDDIKDITKIPIERLLEYNLVDSLSTWFVKEKYEPVMIADQQGSIYNDIFKPAIKDIIQMQLTGMPVNMPQSIKVSEQLTTELDVARSKILASPIIKSFTAEVLDVRHTEKRNAKLKAKRIAVGDEPQTFNPNSDDQMRALLFDYLDMPVINLTDSKLPSTDGETIEALLNRVEDPEIKSLLESLQLFAIIGTLTTNFMPSILGAVQGPDGWHYLFGNFNLGGTLSGRLSSSGPNLQNLPSTGKGHKIKLIYAKMIKSCFGAPPGWLFCGIDFSSLEDRISALTTKDPNKLKVYTDGYDGHSLRAFAYFRNQMPDIIDTVDSINSVQKKYKPLRDRSKNPTFTLTYQGTWHALVKKYAFSPEQAKEVEAKYHELYKVSDDWVNAQLDQAMTDGYITGAFGLRLRTPLLKQVIRGTSRTPFEAEAEGRTAGNALGQSWCLLNSRAGSEFMGLVRASQYRLDIKPCAQIHDASYFLIRDDIDVIHYTNTHLVNAVKWQNHPDIWHDEVKLGGEFGIFYPDWNREITIPNDATKDEIFATIDAAMA